MKFSKHVFISYTHIDNQKLAGQEHGWVSRFHDTLSALLEMRLGEKVTIWRDNKLAGNDEFAEEILAQFPDVAMLVSILSPRYLNSDWCKREANEFCRVAQQGPGIQVARKSRLFKVLKLPVESLAGLPPEFNHATGFCFYKSKDDVPFELDPAYGGDMAGDFNLGVAILAQKLAETVKVLQVTAGPLQAGLEWKATVYLAETSWDREPERKLLEAELTGRGYLVLPDRSLPSHEDECRSEVQKILGACEIAVHMIGSQSGMVLNGPTQKSVDELQNELAAAESVGRGIRRIVWINSGQSKNPSHQKFIDLLNRDDRTQFGADIVTGDFETLKGAVLSALQKLQQQKSRLIADLVEAKLETGKLIYIICDKRDAKSTVELRKALRTRGFEPRRPLFEGDAATLRQQNDVMLQEAKTIVLYYGAGDEGWYQSTLDELKKSRTPAPVWTYLAAPVTCHKEELLDEFQGGSILNGMSSDPPDGELDRLVSAAVRRAAAGGPTA
jgi:hypothetical protein